jgi:hypothetical protein
MCLEVSCFRATRLRADKDFIGGRNADHDSVWLPPL